STADAKRDEYREKGVNPFSDTAAFDEVDALYRAADDAADQARVFKERERRALELRGGAGGAGGGAPGGRPDRPLTPEERGEFASLAQRYLDSDVYARLRQSGLLDQAQTHFSSDPV